MGEKYTAAFAVLAVALLILRPRRGVLIHTFVFGFAALLAASPWYIRNWFFVGNPVYPFIFGGTYWDAFRAQWYSRFGTGLWNQPLNLLLAPFDASFGLREEFNYQGAITPLVLMFIVLRFLSPRVSVDDARNQATRALWIFASVIFAVWLVGVAQSKLLWQVRLLFPALPAFAILAADGFARFSTVRLRRMSLAWFGMLIAGLIFVRYLVTDTLAVIDANPLVYLFGFETRAEYLTRRMGAAFRVDEFVNTSLPNDAHVLTLWEPRTYYIERTVTADAILDKWAHWRYQYQTADAIADEWRREGITHILLSRTGLNFMLETGYDPITRDDALVLQDLIARHLRQVYGTIPFQVVTRDDKFALAGADQEAYAVYELRGR